MDSYVRAEYTANDMLMLAARGINGETRSFGGCEIADDGTRKTTRLRRVQPSAYKDIPLPSIGDHYDHPCERRKLKETW